MDTKPLFSVGTSRSTRALEIAAIALFAILALLSTVSSAYYVAILFGIIALIFFAISFRMARLDFYEEFLRIQRRKTLLREIPYSSVEYMLVNRGTRTMPPRISLKVKSEETKIGWVGSPRNKELDADLLTWLGSKGIEARK